MKRSLCLKKKKKKLASLSVKACFHMKNIHTYNTLTKLFIILAV